MSKVRRSRGVVNRTAYGARAWDKCRSPGLRRLRGAHTRPAPRSFSASAAPNASPLETGPRFAYASFVSQYGLRIYRGHTMGQQANDQPSTGFDRRRHARAEMVLPVNLHRVGDPQRVAAGTTVNVTAGGLLIESPDLTSSPDLGLLEVQLGPHPCGSKAQRPAAFPCGGRIRPREAFWTLAAQAGRVAAWGLRNRRASRTRWRRENEA